MGKKNRLKSGVIKKQAGKTPPRKAITGTNNFKWIAVVLVITAICLVPMLGNEFTNWDDQAYVLKNDLLKGPDWKGIFSEPLVGNYHPLTVITLAANYALSGLEPFSYMLVNYLLHLVNTLLVFLLIFRLSGKRSGVAAFAALVFGIHPMHVESVAWISERKDVLYAFFFLLSLLQYWKYLGKRHMADLLLSFLFFALSLLSKPAAAVLPLVLLILDFWYGRKFTGKMIIEKIPFFLFSIAIGIVTLMIQSSVALTSIEVYSFTDRLFFGTYVLMTYLIRFFIPYPLSTLHPFPPSGNLGWPVWISPLVIAVLLVLLWYRRKDKVLVFGVLFFLINLLLVLQVLTVGISIVSERYTYMPYIGLSFIVGMKLDKMGLRLRSYVKPAILFVALVFGILTWQRTKVWKNSGTLWANVLDRYPNSPHARTNRADYLSKLAITPEWSGARDSLYKQAIQDCRISLEVKPNHAAAYEILGLIDIELKNFDQAFSFADSVTKYKPDNKMGYDIRGTVYFQHKDYSHALAQFDTCIMLMPDDHRSYNNRGTIYLTGFNRYREALNDFNRAISINPLGSYYLNRSISYFHLGDLARARADADTAIVKGTFVADQYKKSLNKN